MRGENNLQPVLSCSVPQLQKAPLYLNRLKDAVLEPERIVFSAHTITKLQR